MLPQGAGGSERSHRVTADVIDLAARRPAADDGPTESEIRFAKAAAQQRLRATKGQEHVLPLLMASAEWLTTNEAAAYFQVNTKVVHYIARTHYAELQAVGYERGTRGPGNDSRFSRRALLHMALIVKEGTSERADIIKQRLGVWTGRPSAPQSMPSAHEQVCRELLRCAKRIAEEIQDSDPKHVWDELSAMDRHELQGVTVALAALLPLDQHGLHKYLTQVGLQYLRDNNITAHPSRAASAGLSALVPEPEGK